MKERTNNVIACALGDRVVGRSLAHRNTMADANSPSWRRRALSSLALEKSQPLGGPSGNVSQKGIGWISHRTRSSTAGTLPRQPNRSLDTDAQKWLGARPGHPSVCQDQNHPQGRTPRRARQSRVGPISTISACRRTHKPRVDFHGPLQRRHDNDADLLATPTTNQVGPSDRRRKSLPCASSSEFIRGPS